MLELAAKEGQARVDEALRSLLDRGEVGEGKLNAEVVRAILSENRSIPLPTSVDVAEVSLASFAELLSDGSGVCNERSRLQGSVDRSSPRTASAGGAALFRGKSAARGAGNAQL